VDRQIVENGSCFVHPAVRYYVSLCDHKGFIERGRPSL